VTGPCGVAPRDKGPIAGRLRAFTRFTLEFTAG
jgi:hypothetical protein